MQLIVGLCGILAVLPLRSPAVASSSVARVTSQGYSTSAKLLQDDRLVQVGPKTTKKKEGSTEIESVTKFNKIIESWLSAAIGTAHASIALPPRPLHFDSDEL